MKNTLILVQIFIGISLIGCQGTPAPKPLAVVPTENQIKWHEMERNAFIHFGPNTFTDKEWGYGNVPAAAFNPSELDAEQWCRIIKEAGLKGVILTAKHHDGFCLWPSKYTEYSVKNSPWREGKGDLVQEVSEACKKYGLKFGVYLSPWDRNSGIYGTPEYIDYFRNQLTELLTNYGDVFEVWFDGANGGTGYYNGANEKRSVDRKTYYDWKTTNALVKKLQPNALIFSDGGPDIRWCGNEKGIAGKTNWATLRRDEVWPGWPRYKELNPGHEDGNYWVPAEINVSIRPGWFYHKSEDHKVKDISWLMDYYYESVGRNGTGLLNFPIDDRGLIHEVEAEYVTAWQKKIQADFANNLLLNVTDITASNVRGNSREYHGANVNDSDKATYWATDDGVTSGSLLFSFDAPITFNRFLVQEDISLGQRVEKFTLEVLDDKGIWEEIANETTIGYKRILRFPAITSKSVKFSIKKAKGSLVISNIGIYNAPKLITTPEIIRDQEGLVNINIANKGLDIFYTVDGSVPNTKSNRYLNAFNFDKKGTIKAIAIDNDSERKSPVVTKEFDISKKDWKVYLSNDSAATNIFDGNVNSKWFQTAKEFPIDLDVDLGKTLTVIGFTYLPDQTASRHSKGIIFNYEFLTSIDGKKWQTVSSGEFSNIKNSPIWQIKNFAPVKTRFVKLRALSNTSSDSVAGYAEFGIITE
ncbi:alpha-L-fucosidase [Tamlana sp. 2201CG12-4]|uniref:alpha-L-fucosidase n=1 Tax=Tamlana sp. 2201CG12-4 TaxID=3112582 RepID=UPI002DBB2852|nr:alpha-L-fucosidase [Tamlana sp. 2201CG12-4]MEC3907205.1 alpha-L-fucosidase [Tamlana sp. 2201CG12-4]